MLRNEIFKCAQVLVLCSVLKGTVHRWPDWLFLFSPFPSGVWSSWVPVTQHWCCRWFLNCSAHTRTLTHQSLTWTIRPVSFTYLKIFFFFKHLCSCRHATSTSFCSSWTKSESLHTSCPVHFIHQPLWFGCTANCTWAVFLFLIPHF